VGSSPTGPTHVWAGAAGDPQLDVSGACVVEQPARCQHRRPGREAPPARGDTVVEPDLTWCVRAESNPANESCRLRDRGQERGSVVASRPDPPTHVTNRARASGPIGCLLGRARLPVPAPDAWACSVMAAMSLVDGSRSVISAGLCRWLSAAAAQLRRVMAPAFVGET